MRGRAPDIEKDCSANRTDGATRRTFRKEKTRMKKKLRTQKGFTLAELLIVVAIIGVLVAISIPIFGPRLEGSREATDAGNLRSAYAAATSAVLVGKSDSGTLDDGDNDLIYTKDGTLTTADKGTPMMGKSTQAGWQGTDLSADLPGGITFDGNSKKGAIQVRVNTIDNTVQVMFAGTGTFTTGNTGYGNDIVTPTPTGS